MVSPFGFTWGHLEVKLTLADTMVLLYKETNNVFILLFRDFFKGISNKQESINTIGLCLSVCKHEARNEKDRY